LSDAFQLGPLLLPTALLVVVASAAATLMVGRLLDRTPGKEAETTLWTGLLVGAGAARLAFVFEYRALYFASPLSVLDIRDGGWSAPVGLAACLIFGIARMRRRPEWARPIRWGMGVGTAVFMLGLGALAMRPDTNVTLPDLTFRALDGRPVPLRAFAGKPTVVNLWATWCPPCIREMPVLEKAQRARPDVNFVFLNQGEDPARVAAWLASRRFEMANVLIDEVRQASAAFKQQGYPTTLFFDRQGRLVTTRVGELSEATLAERLSRIDR
jgi:thiol-disulfide isomerase/thioredoxin